MKKKMTPQQEQNLQRKKRIPAISKTSPDRACTRNTIEKNHRYWREYKLAQIESGQEESGLQKAFRNGDRAHDRRVAYAVYAGALAIIAAGVFGGLLSSKSHQQPTPTPQAPSSQVAPAL